MRCAWQKRSIPLFIFGLPLARQFRKHLSCVGERACGGRRRRRRKSRRKEEVVVVVVVVSLQIL